MMFKINILLILFLSSFLNYGQKQFETITYDSDDSTTLELDFFKPITPTDEVQSPLFIFVHGGGFSNGSRESGHNICEFLANNGIASASISYSLYMKNKSFSCNGILKEKMKAIQIASNQLWLACNFIIDNNEKFKIDLKNIFIGGSSAGAETALQAAFGNRNLLKFHPINLPQSFKFAGIISGAGALTNINNVNKDTKIPALFFHGTCDKLVPYGTAPHHYCNSDASGWMMMFGAYTIHEKLTRKLNESSYLITYCGGGHEYAGKPFSEEKEIILRFIKDVVNGEKFQFHKIIPTGNTCETSELFEICN